MGLAARPAPARRSQIAEPGRAHDDTDVLSANDADRQMSPKTATAEATAASQPNGGRSSTEPCRDDNGAWSRT